MLKTIKTTFQNGAFVPQTPVDFPEGAEVEITIKPAAQTANGETILTDDQREQAMSRLLENMKSNPIPEAAPRKFTREELYERR